MTEDLGKRLRDVLDTDVDAATRLRRVVSCHVQAVVENRTFYAIVFSEEAELSEAGRRRFRAWAHDVTGDFERLLAECIAETPSLAGMETWVAANLILTMLTSLYRLYDTAGSTSPEQLVDQISFLLGNVLPISTDGDAGEPTCSSVSPAAAGG